MKSFNHQLVFGLFAHVALLVGPATAQGIYYSLQGEFVSCGDEQQLFFDVTDGIASFEEVRIRTYHSSGTLGGSNLLAMWSPPVVSTRRSASRRGTVRSSNSTTISLRHFFSMRKSSGLRFPTKATRTVWISKPLVAISGD